MSFTSIVKTEVSKIIALKQENLGHKIQEKYSNCDVEVQFGGQPVYYYIISAE